MPRLSLPLFVVAVFVGPAVASAADVSGSMLYDGLPVGDLYYDIGSSSVSAVSITTGERTDGTVDLVTNRFEVTGLDADDYYIEVFLDRIPPVEEPGNPGDLRGQSRVEIDDPDGEYQRDIDILINYTVYAPFVSGDTLVGSGWTCAEYPTFSYPITVGLEAVPRATEYVLNVELGSCSGSSLGLIEERSESPWFDVPWGTAGEDYHSIWLTCTGSAGTPLCIGPTHSYADGSRPGLFLRDGDDPGRGIHHTDSHVIPAAAKVQGANGVFWYTGFTVVSQHTHDRNIEIIFTPRGVDGSKTYISETLMLDAGEQHIFWDAVGTITGSTGTGAIEIRGQDLVISSRTYTHSPAGGSYGQGISPIQPEQVLSLDGTPSAKMGGVKENESFRTNLGLCEIWGEPATVRVSIDDGTGPPSHADYQLRPYENIQINRVAEVIAGMNEVDEGVVTVSVTQGNGRVGAYLSVVDNFTADPTYVAIAPQQPSGS